jgi:hypothetical protein
VAGERTVVVAVALLLLEFASGVLEVAVAVLLRTDPAGTLGATRTFNVNTALLAANEGFEQETVPASPASGAVHDHPSGALKSTKDVPAGSVSVHEALPATSGPLLATVIV